VLTDEQIERYSRQILLPEIGGRGQETLLRSTVALIGHGFLTDRIADYLQRAGLVTIALDTEFEVEMRQPPDVVVDTSASFRQAPQGNRLALRCRSPLVWARVDGEVARVATLGGHQKAAPCGECVAALLDSTASVSECELSVAAVLWAAGRTATEVLHFLLEPNRSLGEMAMLNLGRSTVTVTKLSKDPGCRICLS
jgi:molybdopterin/thiamine biosynthesis adenylyltransferase